jgi:hypothetical protein
MLLAARMHVWVMWMLKKPCYTLVSTDVINSMQHYMRYSTVGALPAQHVHAA